MVQKISYNLIYRVLLSLSVLAVSFLTISPGTPVKALAEPTEVLNLNVSSKTATSITLSWSPPAEGPSSVEDYLFRYSSNGTTWSSPLGITTSTTATVSGLNRGQTYYFQVAARNSIGNGPWQSSVFTAVPAVLPSAPVALAV